MSRAAPEHRAQLEGERRELLERVSDLVDKPMAVLGLVWLVLLILDFTGHLTPFLAALGTVIWVLFILQFLLELTLAPRKGEYLRTHWLTVLSLAVPALRVVRVFGALRALQALRAARGLRLVRVLGSLNRGMSALSAAMGRRGFGYVVALTTLVTLAGAAGMYAFESPAAGGGLESYGSALWWTAMIMTTLGSEYWPRTPEGRVLCIVLALYAFAVFGYVTATLASFFVGRDADRDDAEVAGARAVAALREEIAALRAEMREAAGRER
ncbi:MAG TPA: ion transporter [Gemmatimonadaceae bacterium]|nr:ion transporter [Gemmatimonadaceae bacterium]